MDDSTRKLRNSLAIWWSVMLFASMAGFVLLSAHTILTGTFYVPSVSEVVVQLLFILIFFSVMLVALCGLLLGPMAGALLLIQQGG